MVDGKTEEEHDLLLREVFGRLEIHGIRVHVRKIEFKHQEVRLLGVGMNGVEQTV